LSTFFPFLSEKKKNKTMVQGTLQVLLVNAKKLNNSEFFGNMDPYAILKCRSHEQKSSVAKGAGTEPQWNESFVFTVSDDTSELFIKLMDEDNFTADDFLGEARIPLAPVFQEGNYPATVYRVVKDEQYCGEVKVSLTFTPSQSRDMEQQVFGGWKQSTSY
jgi:Ca2+-dependent lipid-binding protein